MQRQDPHQGPEKTEGPPLQAELTALIRRWRGPLVGLLMAWRVQDPSDLAQEVFTELWLGRARFRGSWGDGGAVGPWLRGIAWNLASAERRRAALGPRALEDGAESLPGSAPGPAETARALERGSAVREAIEALPADLRAVVYMRGLEAKPGYEVAHLLGISERAVEGRYYRARQRLKVALAQEESTA